MAEAAEELPSWELDLPQQRRRFANITDNDVDALISNQENENTKKKTRYDLKIVKAYLLEVHKQRFARHST